MKAMFHQFDKNKNEELEREELAALVKAMGRNLFGTNENTILENFDENRDGKLQYTGKLIAQENHTSQIRKYVIWPHVCRANLM